MKVSTWGEVREDVHMQGTSERSLSTEGKPGTATAEANEGLILLAPTVYRAEAKGAVHSEDIPIKVDIEGAVTVHEEPKEDPERQGDPTKLEEPAKLEQPAKPEESAAQEVPNKQGGVNGTGDDNNHQSPKHFAVNIADITTSLEKHDKAKVNGERDEERERDPMAPRMRIVPPSVEGMEKPAVVIVRPTSVYW